LARCRTPTRSQWPWIRRANTHRVHRVRARDVR
jgi:hypothetical protein